MSARNCTSMIHVRARGTICALHNHYWKARFALFIFDNFSINAHPYFNYGRWLFRLLCLLAHSFTPLGKSNTKNKIHVLSDSGFCGFFCNLVMHRSREGGCDKICKVGHQSILPSMQRKNGIERLSRCLAVAAPATVCRPDGRCMGALAQTKVERVRGNS